MSDKKILIVDDEVDLLKALEVRFSAQGYTVLTAEDGLKGLDMARRENPDLILLDLMLPKLNGFTCNKSRCPAVDCWRFV